MIMKMIELIIMIIIIEILIILIMTIRNIYQALHSRANVDRIICYKKRRWYRTTQHKKMSKSREELWDDA